MISSDYLGYTFETGALSLVASHHPRAPFWNALAAIQEGDFQNALVWLSPISETYEGRQLLALAYVAQGDYQNATQIYEQINSPRELVKICQSARMTGNLNDATTACYAAFELDFISGTYPLASLLIEREEYSGAEMVLRSSLKRIRYHQYRPFWLFSLADTLGKQGRWAESIEFQREGNAAQLLIDAEIKSQPQYYADLARAYQMNGQIEDAVRTIEIAIDQPEHDFDLYYVWFLAAQIYETAGLLPQALAAYQFCLELRPDSTTASEAIARLVDAIH